MIGLQLLLVATTVIVKLTVSQHDPHRSRCKRLIRYLFTDTLSWIVLFTTLTFSFSCGLFFRNLPNFHSFSTVIMNVFGIILQLRFSSYYWSNVFWGKLTPRWRMLLKEEPINKNRYPLFLLAQRTLFGLLCGLLFDVNRRGFALLVIQVAYLLYLAIRNPYLQRWMAARLLINESVILLILVATIVSDFYKVTTEAMWVEAALLIGCMLYSFACYIVEIYLRFNQPLNK